MTVYDLRHCVAASDQMKLVPILNVNVAGELVTPTQSREQPGFLSFFGPDNLAAPRDDASARRLLVKLAGETIAAIEIELRPQHIPFGLRGSRWRRSSRSTAGTRPLRPSSAAAPTRTVRVENGPAVLDSSINGSPLAFHFDFQLEIRGLAALP